MNISINANSVSGLATVATTGAYSDLSGRPSLATVATSGSYNDLSNKPTISTGKVTQKFNKTFNVNNIGTTKSITGLSAYKPVFIVLKVNSGNSTATSVSVYSGCLYNSTNKYDSHHIFSSNDGVVGWGTCVPTGTSISLGVYSSGTNNNNVSLAVYQ